MVKKFQRLNMALLPMLLSGCWSGGLFTTVGPDYQTPELPTAATWQAPQTVAHQGDAKQLQQWWQGFNDPVLSQFLAAAQQVSASVAEAKARIEQSRANVVGAEGSILPSIDFSTTANRSSASFGGSPFVWNRFSVGLQSSWEIDLFGGLARQAEAARSQLESRNAAWHDARVAVAVEVANAYVDYRYCETQLKISQTDSDSRRESAKLAEIAEKAGFRAASDVALANASAAEGNRNLLPDVTQPLNFATPHKPAGLLE
jgi:outer membrane protein TolC